MKVSEYYGVQFAQGQYVMHCESGRYTAIPDKLFVSEAHPAGGRIGVSYEGLGAAEGRENVKAFFERLAEMTEKNGGLLRVDLPHTQKVTVSEDGLYAVGEWDTMTERLMGAAFGNDLKEAPLDYCIGHFENTYACEDGAWKFVSIKWTETQPFGNWTAKDVTANGNNSARRPFPEPFGELGVIDDATASPETLMTINLRNQAVGIFQDYNKEGITAITEKHRDRFSEDALREALRMLQTRTPSGQFYGKAMVTSPIVQIEKEKNRAQLYLLVGLIKPVDDHRIAHSRGRINAELILEGENWKFISFAWNRYATMEPWELR